MAHRWHILADGNIAAAEFFLREREKSCVPACAAFLRRGKACRVWFMPDAAGNIAALLIQKRGSLFPVLDENADVSTPAFLARFLSLATIHSIQGIPRDAEVFEFFLNKTGRRPAARIDYDFLYTDIEPLPSILPKGPPGLILRTPALADIEDMFPLQSDYEKEEVLPPGTAFNAASCRLSLERIISREYVLTACLGGRIVGKVNTNAESFTRRQIGGVYVHADYRCQGIATLMTAAMVQKIIAGGKGVSLFVKKRNAGARTVYRRAGFISAGEYRIVYF